jgi:hypothetical protein
VLGYRPKNLVHDGKVKVKLPPPKGLPPLEVHAKNRILCAFRIAVCRALAPSERQAATNMQKRTAELLERGASAMIALDALTLSNCL